MGKVSYALEIMFLRAFKGAIVFPKENDIRRSLSSFRTHSYDSNYTLINKDEVLNNRSVDTPLEKY